MLVFCGRITTQRLGGCSSRNSYETGGHDFVMCVYTSLVFQVRHDTNQARLLDTGPVDVTLGHISWILTRLIITKTKPNRTNPGSTKGRDPRVFRKPSTTRTTFESTLRVLGCSSQRSSVPHFFARDSLNSLREPAWMMCPIKTDEMVWKTAIVVILPCH